MGGVNESLAQLHNALGSSEVVAGPLLTDWAHYFLVFLKQTLLTPTGSSASHEEEDDFSLRNTHSTVRALCAGLARNEATVAVELGQLLDDPPDAPYVGPKSEVCTPDQQQLAYAIKHLVLGEQAAAQDRLKYLRPAHAGNAARGDLVDAVLRHDADGVVSSVERLVRWCDEHRRKDKEDWDRWLEVIGLGLVAYAQDQQILTGAHRLPSSPYLPLDWIPDSASTTPGGR